MVEQALKHAENDELHRGHFADEGAECDDGAEAKARVTRVKTNKQKKKVVSPVHVALHDLDRVQPQWLDSCCTSARFRAKLVHKVRQGG